MESRERKNLILVVVLIGVAIGTYFWMSGDDLSDEDAATKSAWHCTACGKSFEMTAQQLRDSVVTEERTVDLDGTTASPDEPRMRGRGDRRLFNVARCPYCKEWKGEAARKCPECGEIFPAKSKTGEPGVCPKCNWDSHTGRKADGDHRSHDH